MNSRKPSIVLVLTVASLITLQTSQAVDVYTDPVGFYKVSISSGANVISAPLQRTHDYRGLVTSMTSNTVTVSGAPGWTANQFGPKDGFSQYIVLLRQDASASPGNEGDWWTVVSNTSSSLTVNVGVENLTAILGVGDQVEIRHLTTMADLFGTGASLILNKDSNGDPQSLEEDVIRRVSGFSFASFTFYHDGSLGPEGYYIDGNGPFDGTTATFYPDEPVVVNRKAGSTSTNIVSLGQVQVKKLTHYLQPGGNIIASPFPSNAPLNTTGLLESGWIQDSNGDPQPSEEDMIRRILSGSAVDFVFYHDGTLGTAGWYVNGEQNDTWPLMPGGGYAFFIKGPSALKWRQVVPFSP